METELSLGTAEDEKSKKKKKKYPSSQSSDTSIGRSSSEDLTKSDSADAAPGDDLGPSKDAGRQKRRRKKRDADPETAEAIKEKIAIPKSTKVREKSSEPVRDGYRVEGAEKRKPSTKPSEKLPAFPVAPQAPKGPNQDKSYSSEIAVYSLSTSMLGKYEMEKGSTLADLRRRIEGMADSNGQNKPMFSFYDLQAKQKIVNESQQKVSKLPAVVVVDKESSLSAILAQSTIMGDKSIRPGKNSMSFHVVWYEPIFKTFHPVVLHFADSRISVHASGGAFNLFDVRTLRVPLAIRPVVGSKKAFQFAQHEDSTRVSQFFCSRNSLRQALFVYFSFVWRPRAVRRGYLPPMKAETNMNATLPESDPKSFVELLKNHAKEISSIIQEIDAAKDPKLVKAYLNVFFHMFSGVEASNGVSPTVRRGEVKHSGTKIRELQLKIQAVQRKSTNEDDKNGIPKAPHMSRLRSSAADSAEQYAVPGDEIFGSIQDPLYLEEMKDLESRGRISLRELAQALAEEDDGSGPPPPPPPPPPLPPPSLKMIPPIVAVNFDSIPVGKIAGTVWEEISSFSLPEQARASLAEDLKRTFGSSNSKKSQASKDPSIAAFENSFTILDPARLRNVEVLLHMTELRELGNDVENLIQAFKSIDVRVFNIAVLERLVRTVGSGDNRTHAVLPSRAEISQLQLFENYCESRNVAPLDLLSGRPGELLFYRLYKEVPDREERLTFCYFMEKFQVDKNSILKETQVVLNAVEAVYASASFKKVLRIVFEILNVLNPKQGLSRGFRISTLITKIDRITGYIHPETSEIKSRSLRPTKTSKFTWSRKRTLGSRAKTVGAQIRSQLEAGEPDVEQEAPIDARERVQLFSYLAGYLQKFPECSSFWQDLVPCISAQAVDIQGLEQQSMGWMSKLREVEAFVRSGALKDDSGPFGTRIASFLQSSKEIEYLSRRVGLAKERVESLWTWLGETIDTEPQTIFRYISHFASSFEKIHAERYVEPTNGPKSEASGEARSPYLTK